MAVSTEFMAIDFFTCLPVRRPAGLGLYHPEVFDTYRRPMQIMSTSSAVQM